MTSTNELENLNLIRLRIFIFPTLTFRKGNFLIYWNVLCGLYAKQLKSADIIYKINAIFSRRNYISSIYQLHNDSRWTVWALISAHRYHFGNKKVDKVAKEIEIFSDDLMKGSLYRLLDKFSYWKWKWYYIYPQVNFWD